MRPRDITELAAPEFRRLVKKDFTVGREAVLFVALCKQQGGTLTYRLVGILYGDSEKPKHLDELCEQIRQAVQSGDTWARSL